MSPPLALAAPHAAVWASVTPGEVFAATLLALVILAVFATPLTLATAAPAGCPLLDAGARPSDPGRVRMTARPTAARSAGAGPAAARPAATRPPVGLLDRRRSLGPSPDHGWPADTPVGVTDPVTGALSRAGLRWLAEQARALGRRSGRRDAVLLVHLDGWAALTDARGWDTGAAAMRAAVGVLRAAVRESDLVGRVGHDTFVIYAVGLDSQDQGWALAGRVMRAVGRHNLAAAGDGRSWALEVSLEVGVLDPDEDLAWVLQRAGASR